MPEVTAEPAVHMMNLDGKSFGVRQITEGTWTASATGKEKILAQTPSAIASLRQAIERVSGCYVTDSDYSQQGTQFDAQVSCASGLDN